MNKAFVLQQLRDAGEQLGELIRDVEADDSNSGDLMVGLPVIYRYLNLAWNSTQIPEEELFRALEQEGQPKALWGFPRDLEAFIHD